VIDDYPETNSINEIPKNLNKRQQERIKLDADIYYKKLEIQNRIMKKKEICLYQKIS
jgi:hypothetical protein